MALMAYTAVIPAYNAEAFLVETIKSILDQSVPPVRVIVVDDGSKDRTLDIARGLGGIVEAHTQANTGPGAATTRAMALVETPLIATCDADDLWLADKASKQIAYLQQHQEIAAVFSRLANFSGPDGPRLESAYDGWTRTTMMIRSDVAVANGAIIDPPGRAGDMVDWLARLREGGNKTAMIDEVLALRRVHEGSMTFRDRTELGKAYLQVVRDTMLRKRNASK